MCGPKCTCFIFLVSIWGVCFLTIVGGLFYNNSVGLLEDLPGEEANSNIVQSEAQWEQRSDKIKDLYKQNAYNSWVAAAIHLGVAAVCLVRLTCIRIR
ncbi:hypothetical protein L596_005736 [Steinernema carpocapsae]|uniref:Uncharacterized protein n=1 Tax=Steinernema carpocapsae TaxID=34508 RepID=A0A4U8UZY9_STECR|nr:hypothetical protein L596_005736 [Steinernema carpocapsae]